MTKEERKAYSKAYYQAHKDEAKAAHKEYYQMHKEQAKEYRQTHKEQAKAYKQEHKEKAKAYMKNWYESHKESEKAKAKVYKKAHKEQVKAWLEAHKEHVNEYKKEYTKADINAFGQTKESIRYKSRIILKKSGINIPGYENHHCFGYDDPSKFIYCSKELHLKIHQFLRDNNIDADSDHYEQIKHLLDEKVVTFGL